MCFEFSQNGNLIMCQISPRWIQSAGQTNTAFTHIEKLSIVINAPFYQHNEFLLVSNRTGLELCKVQQSEKVLWCSLYFDDKNKSWRKQLPKWGIKRCLFFFMISILSLWKWKKCSANGQHRPVVQSLYSCHARVLMGHWYQLTVTHGISQWNGAFEESLSHGTQGVPFHMTGAR